MNILEFFKIDINKLKKANDLCEMVLDKSGADEKKREEIYEDIIDEYYYVEGSGNYITNNIISAMYSVLYDYIYDKYGITTQMDMGEVMLYSNNTRIDEYLDGLK